MSGHLLNGVRVSHQEAQSDWDSLANTRDDVVRIDVPADPQERMAFVRRWMANNQKALKQGGDGRDVGAAVTRTAGAGRPNGRRQ
ncbi:hypothetical protein DK37_00650 [Halomonas sp. SUBG004]|nr:hypothetical protein DK37_00650 [Halomonas sp. SUBG004]